MGKIVEFPSFKESGASNFRFVCAITPDTFMEPIKVISAVINEHGGEIAVSYQDTVNTWYIEINKMDWTVIVNGISSLEVLVKKFMSVVASVDSDHLYKSGEEFIRLMKERWSGSNGA